MSHCKSPNSDKFVSKSRSGSVDSQKKYPTDKINRLSRSPSVAHSDSRSASRKKLRRTSSSSSPRAKSSSKSQQRTKKVMRGDRANPEPNNCVGIFGLSPRTTENDLYSIFDRFGKIERLHLVTDRYTKESRGYCFINYQNVDSATKAVTKADGMEIDGRQIRADYSITQRPHTPTPGQYMGKRTDRPREDRGGNYDGDRRRGGYDERRSRGGCDKRSRGGYDERGRGGYDERGRGGYDERARGCYEHSRKRRRSRSSSAYKKRSRSTSPSYRRNRSRSYDRSRRRNGGY